MSDDRLARLMQSNRELSRRLADASGQPGAFAVHYLFGRPLAEIARILDEYDSRSN